MKEGTMQQELLTQEVETELFLQVDGRETGSREAEALRAENYP